MLVKGARGELGQYHGCSSSFHHQFNNTHCADFITWVCFYFNIKSNGSINITQIITKICYWTLVCFSGRWWFFMMDQCSSFLTITSITRISIVYLKMNSISGISLMICIHPLDAMKCHFADLKHASKKQIKLVNWNQRWYPITHKIILQLRHFLIISANIPTNCSLVIPRGIKVNCHHGSWWWSDGCICKCCLPNISGVQAPNELPHCGTCGTHMFTRDPPHLQ